MSLAPVEAWLCHLLLVWGRCCCWWNTSRCSGQAVQSVCCTWHSAINLLSMKYPPLMESCSSFHPNIEKSATLVERKYWPLSLFGHYYPISMIPAHSGREKQIIQKSLEQRQQHIFKTLLKNKESFDHMNTEQGPTATWSKTTIKSAFFSKDHLP